MDKNEDQSTDSSSSVIAPAPTSEKTEVDSVTSPNSPVAQPHRKWWLLVPLLVVLIMLAYGGYRLYEAHVATKKFNDFALAVKNQELKGADNYLKAANTINEFGNLIDSDTLSSQQKEQLGTEVTALRSEVSQACKGLKTDVAGAEVDQRFRGTQLNKDQKHYVGDAKKVLVGLENTEYSNKGLCRDGPAMVSLVENLATLLPGMSELNSLSDSSLPTAAQLASLKATADFTIRDETALKSAFPNSDAFLHDSKAFLSALYNELAAVKANNISSALQYAGKVASLGSQVSTDSTAVERELLNDDAKVNSAAIQASQDEISAIDYLKKQHVTNPNLLLDYNLPAFRITEATVTAYSDSHDGSYPFGSSVNDLTKLDSNMQQLSDRGFLKHTTYSATGTSRTGFTLETALESGHKLTEKVGTGEQSI